MAWILYKQQFFSFITHIWVIVTLSIINNVALWFQSLTLFFISYCARVTTDLKHWMNLTCEVPIHVAPESVFCLWSSSWYSQQLYHWLYHLKIGGINWHQTKVSMALVPKLTWIFGKIDWGKLNWLGKPGQWTRFCKIPDIETIILQHIDFFSNHIQNQCIHKHYVSSYIYLFRHK